MSNIFEVEKDNPDLDKGTYKLNNDLYTGMKNAVNNNQMTLAMQYAVLMFEIVNEKFNVPLLKDVIPNVVEDLQPKIAKPKTQKVEADN